METPKLSDISIPHGNLNSDQEDAKTKKGKIEGRKILKKKLKVVAKVNEDLELAINTKNGEINELKKAIASLNDVINSVPLTELKNGSSIASTKIVELNKKNRQLRCELDNTKSKNSKLEAKIQRMEQEQKDATKKDENDAKKGQSSIAQSIDSLQEQLQATKQKLFDALNQNIELKNNLKLAQKCIQQEIGENVNLNILVSSGSNWRGRSQQIISLQMKVKELQDKLDSSHHNQHHFSLVDDGHCTVRKLESQRRAEIDELNKQIASLQQTIEEYKNRVSALKVRNKNLTDEVSNYKTKSLGLLEQTGTHDNSIASLNEKFNIQKYQYENKMKEMQNVVKAIEQSKANMELEIEQYVAKYDNLQKVLIGKEQFIEELHTTIHQLEEDLKSISGNFLFSCRNLKKDDFLAILESLETEKKGLISYSEIINQRLELERNKNTTLTDSLTKSKIKINRNEAKIKELQRELEANQEKRKRNQRIQEYSNSLSSSRLSSFVFENSTHSLMESQVSHIDKDDKLLCTEDLRNKLELANEKIISLDEKLTYLSVEHNEDIQKFQKILADSKATILETIQNCKTVSDSDSDYDLNDTIVNLGPTPPEMEQTSDI